ncbi:hypothetical protein ACEWY4_015183 [Coilia grayii]|uniref:BTB domain-containing protein n=1 Tax=Coilia grayii TaxID=363190 RepID=A0ABD1JN96_9TELE
MDAFETQHSLCSDSEEESEINTPGALEVRSTSRSAVVTEEELHKLELAKLANEESTLRQTRWAAKCLTDWLEQQNIKVNFVDVSKEELNQILRQFYGSIRNAKGESYSVSSYLGLRTGLNRYLNDPPLNRSFCIMKDFEFQSANNVFFGLIKTMRREGRDRISHHTSISPSDLNVIRESHACKPTHPRGLLNKVWLDIQLHFGRLGRGGNRSLKKDSFVFRRDDIGRKYCTLALTQVTKKHKDTAERDCENSPGRMFARPGDSMCPVASLEKYLRKLPPDAPAFYLHPKKAASEKDPVWYIPSPLGLNHLRTMLSRICREAGTDQIYTNFCLRGTKVNRSPDVGHESREILSDTGHRFIEFPGHFQKIFQELNNQRTQNRLCDCIVAVGNQYFSAHRSVLAAYSSHFRSLLCNTDASEVQQYVVGPDGNMRLLRLDSEVVTPESFSILLDMMYSSKLLLDMSKITDLLLAASYLHLSTVVKVCKEKLTSNSSHTLLSAHVTATPQPSLPVEEAFASSSEDEEWQPTQTPTKSSHRPVRLKDPKLAQGSKQMHNHKRHRHKSLASKRQKLSGGKQTGKCVAVASAASSVPAQPVPQVNRGFAELDVFEYEYEMPSEADSCDLEAGVQTEEANGFTLKAEDEETQIVELKHESSIAPTSLEVTESTVQMDMEEGFMIDASGSRGLKTTGFRESRHITNQLLQNSSNFLTLDAREMADELSICNGLSTDQTLGITWTTSPKVMKVVGISRSASGSNCLTAVKELNRTTQSAEGAASTSSALVQPVTAETGDAVVLPSVKEGPGTVVKIVGHITALQKPQPVAQAPVVKLLRQPSTRSTRAVGSKRVYRQIAPKSPQKE